MKQWKNSVSKESRSAINNIEVQPESTDDQVPCQSSTTLQVPQPVVDNCPATQRPRRNAVVCGKNLRRELLRLTLVFEFVLPLQCAKCGECEKLKVDIFGSEH